MSFELEPAAMRFTVEFSVCGTEGYATYNADDDVEIGGQSIPRKILFSTCVSLARVVSAAPRLALAIGYDIEAVGWDGS